MLEDISYIAMNGLVSAFQGSSRSGRRLGKLRLWHDSASISILNRHMNLKPHDNLPSGSNDLAGQIESPEYLTSLDQHG